MRPALTQDNFAIGARLKAVGSPNAPSEPPPINTVVSLGPIKPESDLPQQGDRRFVPGPRPGGQPFPIPLHSEALNSLKPPLTKAGASPIWRACEIEHLALVLSAASVQNQQNYRKSSCHPYPSDVARALKVSMDPLFKPRRRGRRPQPYFNPDHVKKSGDRGRIVGGGPAYGAEWLPQRFVPHRPTVPEVCSDRPTSALATDPAERQIPSRTWGWLGSLWSERQDSNLRPLDPQSSALPGCATLRPTKGAPL